MKTKSIVSTEETVAYPNKHGIVIFAYIFGK